MDLDQFNEMNPTQVIDWLLSKSQSVSVSSLEAGRRAWARLKTWAAREQVQLRDGFEATEFQLSSYLSAVHKQSVADATASHEKADKSALKDGRERPLMTRDSTSAALGQWDGLNFLSLFSQLSFPMAPVRLCLPLKKAYSPASLKRKLCPLLLRM